MMKVKGVWAVLFCTLALWVGLPAIVNAADSLSPSTYTNVMTVGQSITFSKTLTLGAGTPTAGQGDVFFLCDTTGSMGGTIDTVKTNASAILDGLSAYGNISTGAGSYKDVPESGWGGPGDYKYRLDAAINGKASTQAGINTWSASGGSDGPESQLIALQQMATSASTGWRTGSEKFALWFGDYPGHEPSNTPGYPGPSTAATISALQAAGITVFAYNVGTGLLDQYGQATAITGATGGSLSNGLGTDVVDTIIAAIGEGFANYSVVGIEAPSLSGLNIAITPTSYNGVYDRSIERTFTFDVTITGLAEGTYDFDMYGLVDGGRVATEHDTIQVNAVPIPAALWLFGAGLMGLIGIRKRVN